MGAAASGAQDAHGFANAVQGGYMPDADTLTYEGVFNEHCYAVGEEEKTRAVATQCFPLVHQGEPWLAVFLKSVFDGKPRGVMPIDLSIVIDVSGSMNGGMGYGSSSGGSRLQHAQRAVEWLVYQVLRADDAVAVSAFERHGHTLQPLTRRAEIGEDFLQPIYALTAGGGTTLAAGMQVGRELLGTDFSEPRHRRILFLTDMGEMGAVELGDMIKSNAADGVYVSIIAMGAEFNASLTETVSKNKGSNYFCATNETQLRECLVTDFDFNMFPAAFEINVSVRSGALEVSGVYGTPFDTKEVQDLVQKWNPTTNQFYKPCVQKAAKELFLASHRIRRPLPLSLVGHIIDFLEPPLTSITEVNTMFPSRLEADGSMKGGVILIRLHRLMATSSPQPLQVELKYEDTFGCAFTQMEDVDMPAGSDFMDDRYSAALTKALLLQRFVQVCREHMQQGAGDRRHPFQIGDRKASLTDLEQEFKQFEDVVRARFRRDKKMNEVVLTFAEFVQMLGPSVAGEQDNSAAELPRDADVYVSKSDSKTCASSRSTSCDVG